MKQEELKAWQPDQFDRFVRILEQDQLNHAYLFSGFFGSLEMAQFLAKSLFCTDKVGVLPCEKCRNCKLIEQEEFPDVTLIKPVNQVIKTERIRELVGQFSQAGIESQQQIFIIEQAEKMHPNAANSLLKVIEEPQSEVYIFFLTSDEEKMLPTIRSRTQIFHFKKQEEKLILLLEQMGLVKKKATLLAQFSQSRIEAEKLANQASFWTLVDESERLYLFKLFLCTYHNLPLKFCKEQLDFRSNGNPVITVNQDTLGFLRTQHILQSRCSKLHASFSK